MRTYFRSLSDVLGSPLAQTAQTFSPRHAGGHRVLKSTKLEDAAYRDLRRGDNELDALEKACGEKLSTFPALSRDIYQSFYSLNVRRQPEDAISEQARRFNAPILNEVMDGEEGEIAGAGLDVLCQEPMRPENPLFAIKDSRKLIITPHMAWAPVETRERLMRCVYRNIEEIK